MYSFVGYRFRSGEVCPETGEYEFDGYLNGNSDGLPYFDELEIALKAGHLFPVISSRHRACYWRLAETPGDLVMA